MPGGPGGATIPRAPARGAPPSAAMPQDPPPRRESTQERLTAGLTRKERLLLGAIVALALGLIVALVAVFWQPAPPSRVVMSTGAPDGAYHAYALRYREILARSGVELVLRPSAGSVENLQRLRSRDGDVTLALVQGGLAEPGDAERIISLGAVAYEPLWVFHRAGLKPQGFEDFRGLRIAGGGPGSGTRKVVDLLLELHGITPGAGRSRRPAGSAAVRAGSGTARGPAAGA